MSLRWLCRGIDTISSTKNTNSHLQAPRLHRVEVQSPTFEALKFMLIKRLILLKCQLQAQIQFKSFSPQQDRATKKKTQ